MSLIDVDALMAKVAATTTTAQGCPVAMLAIVARSDPKHSQPSRHSQGVDPENKPNIANLANIAGVERAVQPVQPDPDHRVRCLDCAHLRGGQCGNHRRAGLHSPVVGSDLARLLQDCQGFRGRASFCH